jgi:GH25 family lysozyme M1 (1,4-beta-N-acetylmuramidase)
MVDRLGVDLSDDQQATSFDKVDFVIVKLGEGLGHAGALNVTAKIKLARAQHVPVAGYWFVHPGLSGQEQAKAAIEQAQRYGLRGIACDAEVTDGCSVYTVRECLKSFLGVVKSWGHAVLYTNLDWAQHYGTNHLDTHVWEAHPGALKPSWVNVQCFQYSFLGNVKGISSPVDLDQWTGSDAFFDAFFGLT